MLTNNIKRRIIPYHFHKIRKLILWNDKKNELINKHRKYIPFLKFKHLFALLRNIMIIKWYTSHRNIKKNSHLWVQIYCEKKIINYEEKGLRFILEKHQKIVGKSCKKFVIPWKIKNNFYFLFYNANTYLYYSG